MRCLCFAPVVIACRGDLDPTALAAQYASLGPSEQWELRDTVPEGNATAYVQWVTSGRVEAVQQSLAQFPSLAPLRGLGGAAQFIHTSLAEYLAASLVWQAATGPAPLDVRVQRTSAALGMGGRRVASRRR